LLSLEPSEVANHFLNPNYRLRNCAEFIINGAQETNFAFSYNKAE